MALKILKSTEPLEVKNIVVAIYSNPGIGKSTLGFTADKPILLDFDGGAYRAANRGDSVQISSWTDAGSIQAEDIKGYNTVIIDTAGRALDYLAANIIKNNPKMGYGTALTLQGYGQLKSIFTGWLNAIKTMGKDVVLIAHSSEDKKGDELIERLDIQGGSKQEVYKSSDAMGRLSIENGKRILNFSPTDTAFGKNPACLDPLEIPDTAVQPDFLATVIAGIKNSLNAMTDEQKKRQNQIADWQATISEKTTADEFTELIGIVTKVDAAIRQTVKGMLHKAATEAGFDFDKASKTYKAKAE